VEALLFGRDLTAVTWINNWTPMYEEERGTVSEPHIEILELTKEHIKFVLHNADLSVANSLRRIIMAEVPTMAIEFVNVKVNTSCMNDEYVAHRLGLIPLVSSNVDQFNYQHENYFDNNTMNSPICSVKFSLKVKNNGTDTIEVTSYDLKQEDAETEDQRSVRPVEYTSIHGEPRHILIMKLQANQELDLECIAQKGQGKLHSKWSPCSVCNFSYEPQITIDQMKITNLNTQQKMKLVDSCPRRVYSYHAKSGQVNIENPDACIFCDECVKTATEFGMPDLIKIGYTKNKFIFKVETNGSLKPDEIIDSALAQLKLKLETVEDALKNIRMGYRSGR
jgi:DNA-directed RNA polymerase II subunit RPB3